MRLSDALEQTAAAKTSASRSRAAVWLKKLGLE
jgi:hypothetical protein